MYLPRVLATLLTNSVHIFTSHFGSRSYEGHVDIGGFSSHQDDARGSGNNLLKRLAICTHRQRTTCVMVDTNKAGKR